MVRNRKHADKESDQEGQFECPVCKKCFNKSWRLDLHLQQHTGQACVAYVCPLCKKQFAFASMFRNHLMLVHNVPKMERPFKCNMKFSDCNRSFSRMSCLKAHMNVHHRVASSFICKKCNKICYTKKHLVKHYKSHKRRKRKQLNCNQCSRKFDTKSGYIWHRFFHSWPKDFNCKYCDKSFNSGDLREMHVFIHHNDTKTKDLVCPTCGKLYKHKKSLLGHSKKCKAVLVCSVCGRSDFVSRRSFKDHEMAHIKEHCNTCGKLCGKGPRLKVHQQHCGRKSLCPLCGIQVTLLPAHIKVVHDGIKQKKIYGTFPCNLCSKVCTEKSQLRDHVRNRHVESEPNLVCEVCGKCFYHKKNLRNHIAVIHDVESEKYGRFICAVCGKVCSRKHHLDEHMEVHNKKRERSFICDICGKSYFNKRNLTFHRAVHDKKQIPCPYCDKVLYTKNGLDGHIRLHTGENCYKCSVCSKGFPSSSGLKYHEKRGKCKGPETATTTKDMLNIV